VAFCIRFASSGGLAGARNGHSKLPREFGQRYAQPAGTPVTKKTPGVCADFPAAFLKYFIRIDFINDRNFFSDAIKIVSQPFESAAALKPLFCAGQFGNRNRHQAYREKVRRYSEEEKRLWEDLKHGMILGTTEFVKKLRDNFLPCSVQKEIPQQLKIQIDRSFKPHP